MRMHSKQNCRREKNTWQKKKYHSQDYVTLNQHANKLYLLVKQFTKYVSFFCGVTLKNSSQQYRRRIY